MEDRQDLLKLTNPLLVPPVSHISLRVDKPIMSDQMTAITAKQWQLLFFIIVSEMLHCVNKLMHQHQTVLKYTTSSYH